MIRAIVVDDDFRVADVHARYLEMLDGFEAVGIAHSGEHALRLVAEYEPDLVLLDMYLPDRSGITVLHALRSVSGTSVDVIAITAARDVDTIRAAMRGGALHYLIKPFTFNAFREKLQSYAAARSRLASLETATQSDVDVVFDSLRTSAEIDTPKGISVATRDLILECLQSATGPQSAAEVARLTGLSRVTARRYLDHLCRSGRALMELEYGSPGRPEHRYWLDEGPG